MLVQESGHPGVFSASGEQGSGGELAREPIQSVQVRAAVHACGCVRHQTRCLAV